MSLRVPKGRGNPHKIASSPDLHQDSRNDTMAIICWN